MKVPGEEDWVFTGLFATPALKRLYAKYRYGEPSDGEMSVSGKDGKKDEGKKGKGKRNKGKKCGIDEMF